MQTTRACSNIVMRAIPIALLVSLVCLSVCDSINGDEGAGSSSTRQLQFGQWTSSGPGMTTPQDFLGWGRNSGKGREHSRGKSAKGVKGSKSGKGSGKGSSSVKGKGTSKGKGTKGSKSFLVMDNGFLVQCDEENHCKLYGLEKWWFAGKLLMLLSASLAQISF